MQILATQKKVFNNKNHIEMLDKKLGAAATLFTIALLALFLQPGFSQEISETGSSDQWKAFPRQRLFYRILADPRDVQMSMGYLLQRNELSGKIGYSGGLFQISPWGYPIQFRIESNVFVVFKANSATFPIQTTDFAIGFPFDIRKDYFSARLKWAHISSHLGDEIPRASEIRIDYSREFWEVLGAYEISAFRFYGGFIWAYHVLPKVGPWTMHFGAEWFGTPFHKSIYPYAAVDLKSRQEVEWSTDVNIQVGLIVGNHKTQGMRLTLEFFDGHSNQGQFFERKERDLNLVVFFDF